MGGASFFDRRGQKSAQKCRIVGGALVTDAEDRSVQAAFDHFALRCSERFGLDAAQARVLFRAVVDLFRAEDFTRLQPVVRLSGSGRRLFSMRLWDQRRIWVLVDCHAGIPVTVFHDGMRFTPAGRDPVVLGVTHGAA